MSSTLQYECIQVKNIFISYNIGNAIIVITPKAIGNGSVFISKGIFPCNDLKSSITIIYFLKIFDKSQTNPFH